MPTTSTPVFNDSTGATFQPKVEGSSSAIVPHHALDLGGDAVSASNPMPVSIIGGITPAGGVVRDASGTTTPAILTGIGIILPNASRRYAFVQNQSVNQLQVVLDDGSDAPGMKTTVILLASGGDDNVQGAEWSTTGLLHTGRIRICGPSGSQFAAAEI